MIKCFECLSFFQQRILVLHADTMLGVASVFSVTAISKRSCPRRSPDLNPENFSLWGM